MCVRYERLVNGTYPRVFQGNPCPKPVPVFPIGNPGWFACRMRDADAAVVAIGQNAKASENTFIFERGW